MSYRFRDRAKEWTSWAGIALSALAVVIPQVLPPDTWWVEAWQAGQMVLGVALIFIPHTAGTTAVENEAWALLKAFAAQLPPAYAAPMQPLIQALASALAQSEINKPAPVPVPAPVPSTGPGSLIVPAQPVAPQSIPVQDPAPAAPVAVSVPKPLVADPAAALNPIS